MKNYLGIYIGLLFSILAILVMSYAFIKNIYLISHGVETKGTVYQEIRSTVSPRRYYTTYEMIPLISFITENYKVFETRGCADCYKIGDKVRVVYDPTNPSHAEVSSKFQLYMPLYYVCGFSIFALLLLKAKKKLNQRK